MFYRFWTMYVRLISTSLQNELSLEHLKKKKKRDEEKDTTKNLYELKREYKKCILFNKQVK